MTYLLDTHVLLWLLGSPQRIPAHVLDTITDPAHQVAVSAASAMEISTKTRLGKLPEVGLVTNWQAEVARLQLLQWPIHARHALLAGSMAWDHRDPFDRLLAAQALQESATLVTVDQAFVTLPSVKLLSW